MSYSTYVLNQKISNLQYDLNTLIPTGFPATISALVIPPSINVLDVVDTIIVEDGLGSGNNSTITSVEVSLTDGATTDYLSITPTTILIDSVTNTGTTTIDFEEIVQQSGLLTNTTSVIGTILTDGTDTITTTSTQIILYDGGINTTTIQANTTNYTNGIDTLNIYPSFVQLNSGGGSAILAGNVLNIQGSGDVDCQVFNTHIDFTSSIGVVANSLTSSSWSGGIASQATVMNMKHYILGSMTATTSSDRPQKNSNLYFNPSLQTLYSTTFSGNLTGTASIANTINTNTYNLATTCYIPFTSSTAGSGKALYVDDTTGPLTYNPSTSTLTASIFSGALSGNATSSTTVSTVSDNTAGTYYLPFVKTTALLTPNQQIYIDDTTGPLTYNPSTSTLTASIFSGALSGNATTATTSTNSYLNASSTGSINYNIVMSSGLTGSNGLYTDYDGDVYYNPSTHTFTSTTFNGALSGNATSSTTVSTVSDNTSGTYYLPFVKTTAILTPNQQIYIDDTTGPLTYNPSTGALTSTSFVGTVSGASSGVNLPTTQNLATFATGVLTWAGLSSQSFKNSNIIFTGTTNIVTTLTTSQQQVNGEYYLSGYNAGTGTLTFNYPLLGTNIKTTYSTGGYTIPTLTYFLMKINVLVANAITLTIVDIKQLY